MRIVRLQIERFRGIRSATLYPAIHNVYLGPNNIGKTAILEALNLLLNPEVGARSGVIDENDFFCREYRHPPRQVPPAPSSAAGMTGRVACSSFRLAVQSATTADESQQFTQLLAIRVEAVLNRPGRRRSEGIFVRAGSRGFCSQTGHRARRGRSIRLRPHRPPFASALAGYDEEEDDFTCKTFFRTDPQVSRDDSPPFTKHHKRRVGFLIYRDFRALQRPITLEPFALFSRLLASQDATPKNFESVLVELAGATEPLFRGKPNFASVVR